MGEITKTNAVSYLRSRMPVPGMGGTLLIGGIALITTAVFLVMSGALQSPESASVILVGIVIFILLCISMVATPIGLRRARNIVFALWWVLLSSEEVFSYMDDTDSAARSNFSGGAYSEAVIWVFVLIGLLAYTLRSPYYLRKVFTGSYKWVTLFGAVCLGSCSFAEDRLFALAWSFKLGVAILLLLACNYEIENFDDLKAFLTTTMFGFAFLVVAPVLRLISDPAVLAAGRLYEVASAPTMLSAVSGTLVLLALMLYRPGYRGYPFIFASLGLLVMLLAGGKTGILAGIFSAFIFFLLQGRVTAAARFLVGLVLVGGFALTFTPLSSYLGSYLKTDQALSVTGRTEVWSGALSLIRQRPIFGHGYMASRFLSYKLDVSWHPGHMHNGFLEALYNNGVVGFICLFMMHLVIIRNMVRVIRSSSSVPGLNQIAVGCFVVYLNVLINGLVSRAFGSRPDATFIVLFAMVFVSYRLETALHGTGDILIRG